MTVGAASVEAVPRGARGARAGDVRARLAESTFSSATEVAVVDGPRLYGIVPIERVLAAPQDAFSEDLADAPVLAAPGDELGAAVRSAAERGARSIAVVDASGRFHGLVPPGPAPTDR